ncbi:MAG: DUF2442 domain-containing protein [Kiritimatiellae bacterium]|jgi:hypothetical protein|nr:DUF2442 domain-containing protein [Kiritimatiellia bacterium]
MHNPEKDFIATSVSVEQRMVKLTLLDGSTHSFPASYYPLLAVASDSELEKVSLRVGGRALRWENLDEDIWIQDAILQYYPPPGTMAVAESSPTYPD